MKYYMFPFTSLPTKQGSKIWFASWSAAQPTVYWSETRPNITPDGKSTWVVGITQAADNPEDAMGLGPDAITLGTGAKELPPPPQPLPPGDVGISGFQIVFASWLERRDA
jgi:hypothetical protein